jgi:general secretion pathway protein E
MEQRFLGEILNRRAGVPLERLEALYAVQREKGIDLVDLLVNGNVIDESSIAQALAAEAELPYVDKVDLESISTALATRLPITFAKQHKIIVTNEDDFSVYVIVGDPFDTIALDEVRVVFSKAVEASVAASEKIEDCINRVYEREAGGGELESDEAQVDEHEVAGGDILDSDDEAPVIRWVNSLFLQAMKERASDIHIEPEEKEVIVRYRIDGELYVARRAPRAFMNSIVSRIKIESALNIAEKRLPQDGRITKKIAGKGFDIRVSTIPTSRQYGRSSTATNRAESRGKALRPPSRTPTPRASRVSSTRCSDSGRCTTRAGSHRRCIRRSAAGASSRRTSGSSTT